MNAREHLKKLIRHFRYRKAILEKYRDKDLDTEILHCMNEINRLRKMLIELRENDTTKTTKKK
jgi:hypothetical protein